MEAQHSQEVSVRSVGEESITLILQKEMELEQRLEAAKAEADRIVDEAKKQAQEIRNQGEKVIEKIKAKAKADQQQNQEPVVETSEKPLTMSEQEQAEAQRLKENAEQNIQKVVEMILQEIIP